MAAKVVVTSAGVGLSDNHSTLRVKPSCANISPQYTGIFPHAEHAPARTEEFRGDKDKVRMVAWKCFFQVVQVVSPADFGKGHMRMPH